MKSAVPAVMGLNITQCDEGINAASSAHGQHVGYGLNGLGVLLGCVGSISINIGNNLQARGHAEGSSGKGTLVIGSAVFFMASMIQFTAFAFAPASVVAPLESLQFVANLAFAKYVNKQVITPRMYLGTTLILVGTVMAVINGPIDGTLLVPLDRLTAFWDAEEWLVYLACVLVTVRTIANALTPRPSEPVAASRRPCPRSISHHLDFFCRLLPQQAALAELAHSQYSSAGERAGHITIRSHRHRAAHVNVAAVQPASTHPTRVCFYRALAAASGRKLYAQDAMKPLTFSVSSALIGTQAVVQAKCAAEAVKLMVAGCIVEVLTSWYLYVTIFLLAACGALWLYRLNTALKSSVRTRSPTTLSLHPRSLHPLSPDSQPLCAVRWRPAGTTRCLLFLCSSRSTSSVPHSRAGSTFRSLRSLPVERSERRMRSHPGTRTRPHCVGVALRGSH